MELQKNIRELVCLSLVANEQIYKNIDIVVEIILLIALTLLRWPSYSFIIDTYCSLLSFRILHSVVCQLHLLAPMHGSSSLHTRNPHIPSHAREPLASPKGFVLHTKHTGCDTVKGPTTNG